MDFQKARQWYDGYRLGDGLHIYNPKSVVDSIRRKRMGNYWTNTETYESLKSYINMNFDGLKDDVTKMLAGDSCTVNPAKFQNDMTSFKSRDDILTLLVHMGYLSYDTDHQKVFIPNEEVKSEFVNAIEDAGWEYVTDAIRASDDLLKATWNMDEQAVAKGIGSVHLASTFNTSGACFEDIHYMVDLDSRIEQIIQKLILPNKYFTINQARQYGKTTMLDLLYRRLRKDCSVFLLSFEDMGSAAFLDEYRFCRTFLGLLKTQIEYGMTEGIPTSVSEELRTYAKQDNISFPVLKDLITRMCAEADRPVVLIIDEVDQASNNQIFLDFLAILRSMYLKRRYIKTFQSVVLASVYDIKNLQIKLRPDAEHKYNSLWNIAADFDIDMSFSVEDIIGMLGSYEQDHSTGMDAQKTGQMIRSILFHGKRIPYSPDDDATRLGSMFGYLKKKDGAVAVSNRIFETRLYNYYLSENVIGDALQDAADMGKTIVEVTV